MAFHKVVPTVIKLLIGTVIFIVMITVLVEVHNVTMYSYRLTMMMQDVMESSCRYFSQESYRQNKGGNAVGKGNGYDITAPNSRFTGPIIKGNFYDGNNEQDIYNGLYGIYDENRFREFKDWWYANLASKCAGSTWYNEDMTLKAFMSIGEPANPFTLSYVTPLNLGITYLDIPTLRKIFRWQLVNKLTAGSIVKDERGVSDVTKRMSIYSDSTGTFIKWHGFRIYILDSLGTPLEMIKDIEFSNDKMIRMYNIYDPYDCEQLEDITHMFLQPDDTLGALSSDETTYIGSYTYNSGIESADDLRNYKVVYNLNWNIPVTYEGILPLWLVNKLIDSKGVNNIDSYLVLDSPMTSMNIHLDTMDLSTNVIPADMSNPINARNSKDVFYSFWSEGEENVSALEGTVGATGFTGSTKVNHIAGGGADKIIEWDNYEHIDDTFSDGVGFRTGIYGQAYNDEGEVDPNGIENTKSIGLAQRTRFVVIQ